MLIEARILHVKWFTDLDTVPLTFQEVISSSFLFWLGITLAGLLLSAIFNEPLQRLSIVEWIHQRLDKAKPHITTILRVGLGIALVLQLVDLTYLAPELTIESTWITVVLVIALFGLLWKKSLFVSGVAITILYLKVIADFGWFHALDYIYYLGIVYFLFVAETKFKETATPVLYLLTGFSLAWVGLEKMVFPEMSYRVIAEAAIPTFGFSMESFVLIAAFIEIGLAWTFIVGILSRFVAILVTLVFITTTFVFGYVEIVGHTIIHTVLIMFIIQGAGTFKTPFQIHRSPLLKYLFVLVNFCVLLFGLMWIFITLAS